MTPRENRIEESTMALIETRLNDQAQAALEAEVIAGCKYMNDTAVEIEREFNPMDEELHRAIEYCSFPLDVKSEDRRNGL